MGPMRFGSRDLVGSGRPPAEPPGPRAGPWARWARDGLLAAVVLGGAGVILIDLDRKARVDRALDEVVRAGGSYMREHGSRSRPVIAIDLDAEDVMDSGEVLPRGRATDATLLAVAKHTSLRWLSLAGAKVTDAGLASLRGLKKLRRLNLSGTPVTDAGLASLEGLADLEIIDLRGTSVTAAGVRQLHLALPDAGIRADVESD
jgi:hypothetical protein